MADRRTRRGPRCPGHIDPARALIELGQSARRGRPDNLLRRAFLPDGPDISRRASAQRDVESAMMATLYPMSRKYSAMVMPVYMDASRAATGMSEVLAISTVRFISDSPVLGSFSSGNSIQNVGHLVAALAAADVDHDLCVGPLCQLMLNHRLARTETGPALRPLRP